MKLSKIILSGACLLALSACTAAESPSEPPNPESGVVATVQAGASQSMIELTSAPGDAPSGAYTNDKGHAYITFHYVHQGYSRPFLRWRNWDSTLNWDADNPENSTVSVTIHTDSIDTGVDDFDDHLKSADWMDVAKHPQATFVSTSVEKTSDRTGVITGDLTLMGITKPVTLDVVFNKAGKGRAPGTYKLGFSATTKLLRSDFGLGKYVPYVGDDVEVIIETEYDLKVEE